MSFPRGWWAEYQLRRRAEPAWEGGGVGGRAPRGFAARPAPWLPGLLVAFFLALAQRVTVGDGEVLAVTWL